MALGYDDGPHDQDGIDSADREFVDRMHSLEGEVYQLRETMGRFAELVLTDLKTLRTAYVTVRRKQGESKGPDGPDALPTVNAPAPAKTAETGWLFPRLAREGVGFIRMFADASHRTRRSTKLLCVGLIALFVFNWMVLGNLIPIPIVSTVFEKAIDLLIGIILYNVLKRELVAYRETVANRSWWMGLPSAPSRAVVLGNPETSMTRVPLE